MRRLPLILFIISVLVIPALSEEDSPFTVTKLTDNLHMLSTDQGEYTTNTLVFFGDDGLLLVDTQTEAEAEALKKIVDGYGRGLPKYIINTHRHVEHIGGNAIFGEEPIVIAHKLVPEKLKSGSYIFNEYAPATFPDILVSDKYTLEFNGEKIDIIPMCGSHDDNEIIVHFTKSKVVHLSSLVNGFNFPSIDSDGDALLFAPLVKKAMEILPHDVVIVSGHNNPGKWEDLQPYHDMLVQTVDVVKKGVDAGKDLETLKKEKVLAKWESYAGSYVSADEWTEYVFNRLTKGKDNRPTPHVPIYNTWKEKGAEAALARYRELKRDQADKYKFGEYVLLLVGDKLYQKNLPADAVVFLNASLEEYPESKYNHYIHYELAGAYDRLGNKEFAVKHCEKALELKPEFDAAKTLLEELKKK